MCDNIIEWCEGDTKEKSYKHQTFKIEYETFRIHDDESIETFFLRLDEVMNSMINLGEEIKCASIIENIVRSLTLKFESKVLAIEEMQHLKVLTMHQLHGILIAFEMRKDGPSNLREVTFKTTTKGKEEEEQCRMKVSKKYLK